MGKESKSEKCYLLGLMGQVKLCITKGYGKLGFRKLRNFNLALIAKQGW